MKEGRLVIPVSEHDHLIGGNPYEVTLVEYGDFQCPYCRAASPMLKNVQRRIGSRLRFVYRHFPLTRVHPNAQHAAEAAESAAAQGGPEAFWRIHDAIFEHQVRGLADEQLAGYASELGLSGETVLEDLAAQRFRKQVREDFMGGVKSGANGTPTFFIDGIRYDGPQNEEQLMSALTAGATA
jgi:protein-disulfide isomerase